IFIETEKCGADERRLAKIERPAPVGLSKLKYSGILFAPGAVAEVYYFEMEVSRRGRNLNRLTIDDGESSAKNFMTPHDFTQSCTESIEMKCPLDPRGHGHQICASPGIQLFVRPNALLRER